MMPATYKTMTSSSSRSSLLLLLSLSASLFSSISAAEQGRFDPTTKAMLGGVRDSKSSENSAEIESLGRFAVEEHNKKENAMLELVRVVKAKEQVVAGTLHYLTLEVMDAGQKKLYEAKIWVKPWMNFKELQEFKHACHVPADHDAN